MYDSPLKDKRILITGAGSGMGHAIAIALLNHGAKVSACARNITALEGIGDENLLVLSGDVSDKAFIDDWVEATVETFSGIDVVINNAGAMYYMDLKSPNYEQMLQMVKTQCVGLINLIYLALPEVLKSDCPHWLNITSDAAKQAFPGLGVYSGTKAFVEFCGNALRKECIEDNLKVTNIQPGNVATPLHQKSTDFNAQKNYGSRDEGQYISTQDIVQAVIYALSTSKNAAVNELLIEPQQEPLF